MQILVKNMKLYKTYKARHSMLKTIWCDVYYKNFDCPKTSTARRFTICSLVVRTAASR